MSKSVAITESYLSSVFKLSSQDKKATLNTVRQLAENPTASSLHVHSIDRVKCDKKFLSARVNLDLRIIFVKRDDICSLLYVDHHDAAYDWCEGKYLLRTDFGSEYIYDERLVQDKIQNSVLEKSTPDYLRMGSEESLFERHDVRKKQLVKLGIQGVHAENLMKITDEEILLEYIDIFPSELQEAIIDLATGAKNFDAVYNELFCNNDAEEQAKNSMRRFYVTENMDELEKLMENDEFEKWTIFLHPSQERLVKKNLNGPLVIEGGPGTGKTIVGIHRAAYLAEKVYKKEDGKKILFCTYSKKLANTIQEKMNRLMATRDINNNIDVMGVDAYIAKMLGRQVVNVDMKELSALIRSVFKSQTWTKPLSFLECEYYEIVEKYNIKSLEEYCTVSRIGMGNSLQRKDREQIWPFFEKLINEKNNHNIHSFVDRAHQMIQMLQQGLVDPMYDAIIIDEAQDLETAKLKAICASVKSERNNLCILSDHNQRIFRLNTWVSDAGINVVGRTFYLTVNYRTTKQINEYARYQFLEFDNSIPVNREYISIMSGAEPEVIGCRTEIDENHVVVEKVKRLIIDISSNEICVLAPTYEKLNAIKSILEYEHISTFMFTGEDIPGKNTGVNLCTTSGVKGLEFTAVIITDFNNIGTQKELYSDNPEVNIDFEKLVECEKYVAVTRARDTVVITYVGEE